MKDSQTQKKFALKILKESDQKFKNLFTAEIECLSKLNHENIIKLIEHEQISKNNKKE